MIRTLFALKLRLFRNGPHNERGFGLVAGLVLAALVIAGAAAVAHGVLHEGWIAVALTGWGGMWVLGPLAQPRHDPSVLSREWLRGYPIPSWRLARALSWTELLGVGPLITLACLLSLLVLAAPAGPAAVAIAGAAVLTQLYLLVWAGKTVAALAAWLLQTRAGMTLAAVQTAIMLALSFAGWVPVAAWLLPRLGDGDSALIALTPGQPPASLIDILTILPTGWGYSAAVSARDGAGWDEVVMPLAVLLAVGALLQLGWIALTAHALRRPPRRAAPKRPATPGRGLPGSDVAPQVRAVAARELATWLRDPARGVELRSAWLTPLLMAPIIAVAGWNWALPFIGPAAAVFGAMVAINTYALDGTALWQILTTPGAVKADVHGRMLAWALLFGTPSVALAAGLWALTASPVGGVAVCGAIVAAAVGCTVAPLLAVIMPAVGADARDRIYPGQQAGDPTGGQMTIFPLVLAAAVVPGVFGAVAGGRWWVTTLATILLATGILAATPALVVRLLRQRGTRLFDAMASRDTAALRPSARTEG